MKRKNLYVILTIILVIIFQALLYMIVKFLQGEPTVLSSNLDNKIPFNVLFIIPYVLWYGILIIIPYYFYKKDKNLFIKYMISYLLFSIIADIIFIIFPTTVIRPEILGNSILYDLTRVVYAIDTPAINCFPSLHCTSCFMWILYVLNTKAIKPLNKFYIIILSILIILSTLFIKQHVIVDVIGGLLLAIVTYEIVTKLLFNKISRYIKFQ